MATKQEKALRRLQSWRVKGRKCYTFEQIEVATGVNSGLLCRMLKHPLRTVVTDETANKILAAQEPTI